MVPLVRSYCCFGKNKGEKMMTKFSLMTIFTWKTITEMHDSGATLDGDMHCGLEKA